MNTHTELSLQEDDTALVSFSELNTLFYHHSSHTHTHSLCTLGCCAGLRIRAQVPRIYCRQFVGCALCKYPTTLFLPLHHTLASLLCRFTCAEKGIHEARLVVVPAQAPAVPLTASCRLAGDRPSLLPCRGRCAHPLTCQIPSHPQSPNPHSRFPPRCADHPLVSAVRHCSTALVPHPTRLPTVLTVLCLPSSQISENAERLQMDGISMMPEQAIPDSNPPLHVRAADCLLVRLQGPREN